MSYACYKSWLISIMPVIFTLSSACTSSPSTPARPSPAPSAVTAPAASSAPTPVTASTTIPAKASAPTLAASPTVLAALLQVAEIVDVDTIKVNINGKLESIRIIGLDTPEVVDPRTVVQCFDRVASAKAKELLSGQQVRLVADPTQDNPDKYDRPLRYVDKADGPDFGLTMIGTGYAHEYTYQVPYTRQAAYKAAQASAPGKVLGLGSPNTCNGETTQPADALRQASASRT